MKTCYNCLWEGVLTASRSFWFIWQHRILMAYLGAGTFVYAAFQFFLYLRFPQATDGFVTLLFLHKTAPNIVVQSHVAQHALMCVETFVYVVLLLLLNTWLMRHTLAYLQGQTISMKHIFHLCLARLQRIAAWAGVTTLIIAGMRLLVALNISHTAFNILLVITLALVLGWSLATFYVLPLLATKNVALRPSCAESYDLAKQTLKEIIGAEIWLALNTALGIAFLLMTSHLTASLVHTLPTTLTFLFIFLAGALCAFIATAQAVIKMMLFYTYYVVPNKQLQFMEYQMFWPI